MKITISIPIWEITADGQEPLPSGELTLRSAPQEDTEIRDFLCLEFSDGSRHLVDAQDLIEAAARAANTFGEKRNHETAFEEVAS